MPTSAKPWRERALPGLALTALVVLAWWYLWQGAGTGMPAWAMTRAVLFPHSLPDMPGYMDTGWPLVVAMWWVMMIAMMTPSVVPLVLLYRRVLAHHQASHAGLCTATLLAGYLLTWLCFAFAATALQMALQPTGLLSDMMWWSRSAVFSALLLAAAGLYQWSPWKHACLTQCRDPAQFLARHAKTGVLRAFRLGVRHGVYCVGCCALLMTLLFVGGIMNLVWIAALSVLVLSEKLLPAGPVVARWTGGVLIAWAIATLIV
jgi:predicted metal-binding membrane protein